MREPSLLVDVETKDAIEVSPDYVNHEYRQKMDAHITALETAARAAGIDYFLMDTSRPLDEGAARISGHPPGEDVSGLSRPMVFGRRSRRSGCPSGCTCSNSTRPLPCPSVR